MRDFLNGLDNLHEYMRYTYPRMRPPSFYVERETANGLTLHYRSRRRGFVHYVMGQITEVRGDDPSAKRSRRFLHLGRSSILQYQRGN